MSLLELPQNVLDDIVAASTRQSQLALAQVSRRLLHAVRRDIYRNIMIVGSPLARPAIGGEQMWTLVPAARLHLLARGLSVETFAYIDKIVLHTHSNENNQALVALYAKLERLWALCTRKVFFRNYDVLSLRLVQLLNNFLAQNSLECIDTEEDCVVTSKGHTVANLRNWFVFDTAEFAALPENESLEQLNVYVEGIDYARLHTHIPQAAVHNVQRLNQLYLQTPLAYLKFTEMLAAMGVPALSLKRLLLTSSHRVGNNAQLDFAFVNRWFDLNAVEELELKVNCRNPRECNSLCMVRFFSEWDAHNERTGQVPTLKKLALVNHKYMLAFDQLLQIVERFVFGSFFPTLEEIYLNLSDFGREAAIDLKKVFAGLERMPSLTTLHISSFMNEWLPNLPRLWPNHALSHYDLLVNQCDCGACNRSRACLSELASIDKENNYNHKGKFSDVAHQSLVHKNVDFCDETNVKYLRYVFSQLKRQEHCVEQNLHSVGTLLNMKDMPTEENADIEPFSELFIHSCLGEFLRLARARAPSLRSLNLGGISFD